MDDLENLFIKIAHRGASAYEPENTLRSFERAIELKADMIELDVRYSLDRHLVVVHDAKVDRTTDGTGLVALKTLSELKELDAGMGEKVPTLEEVIELGIGRIKFVVELKEDGVEDEVVDLINKNNLLEDVFIISFKPMRLKMIKELEPKIRTGLILFASLNPIRLAKDCGADVVAPFHWFITKGLIDRARKSGLYIFTWIVDEASKAQRLREIGVSGIVTNKPDII